MATKKPIRSGDVVGLDGIPLSRRDEKPDPAAERAQFEQSMRAFEAQWRAGDLTAFAKAVRAFWRRWRGSTDWFPDAADKLTVLAMSEREKRLRRKWAIHRTRWEALKELRERRHELFARKPSPGEPRDDRGMSWESAREAVSEALEKTEAEGSPGAIKRSYELVEEAGGENATFEDYLAVLHERGESDD
jgi:hypothetical protein